MKWILVYWIISPGHSQVIHMEKYQSEEACMAQGASLEAPVNRILRWHCSRA